MFNWNATTTQMLLSNVASIVHSTAPLINILAGCFFGIWIIEKVVDLVAMRKESVRQDHIEQLYNEIGEDYERPE